jgi:cyclic-di-GMP-binding biofilm dispersal mediator protein
MPARDLAGASVLVAGATGGLGAPITRLLLDRGAVVTGFVRQPEKLAALGLGVAAFATGDIGDAGDCERAVAAAVAAGGRLDGVVNAAGVVAFGPFEELDDATLEALFRANTLGPLRLVRAATRVLEPGGFVVNLSAVVAEGPVAGMAAYSASKAALTAADVAIGRELRRRRISLIDARPPHTETGLATRPLAGSPPALPAGLAPEAVAARIVAAVEDDERDLPSSAFA